MYHVFVTFRTSRRAQVALHSVDGGAVLGGHFGPGNRAAESDLAHFLRYDGMWAGGSGQLQAGGERTHRQVGHSYIGE